MIKKVLITSMLFLATYAVADQQKEDDSGCSGPLLTIVAVSQDKSNFDQKSNQVLEKFFRSNIKEKENSITMSDLLTVQRKSKNELFVSLNRKGIKVLQASMKNQLPPDLLAGSVKGTFKCTCWDESLDENCQVKMRGKTAMCSSDENPTECCGFQLEIEDFKITNNV